jgi:hypothetical protein
MSNDIDVKNGAFLAAYGAKLLARGYEIIPIAVGKKAPGFDDWSKTKSTKKQLKEWLENGHERDGVGILTTNTPFIDLDIRNEQIALEAEEKVRELIGEGPLRIGNAPKRGLLFRTDKPFTKKRTNKYIDEWGDLHQIEILGDGQQFVAYHIHPDTMRPYDWPAEKLDDDGEVVSVGGPCSIDAEDLPLLTEEQCRELIEWFEERAAQESDWKVHRKTRSAAFDGDIDRDNAFIEDAQPIDISDEELRERLMSIPHPDDYDIWIQIGMALFHQYHGDDKGLELWHEWAEEANNYDRDGLDSRWGGFSIGGKKRAPLTARFIMQLSKEAAQEEEQSLLLKLKDMFINAKDVVAWDKAANAASKAEIDTLKRSSLCDLARDRFNSINGSKVPMAEIKKRLAFSPADEGMPDWVSTWVYDTSDDRFYCTERKISVTKQGFDAMYDRKAMTKKDRLDGKSAPSSTASALALNVYRIKTVQGRRYEPGMDGIFSEHGAFYANTYPEHLIPEEPDELTPRDKKAVERVKNHVRHLLADKRERRIFVDWLSWIVQNPGKHANWSILLQGTEGDGKSFFGFLMQAVMGQTNVRFLNAHSLEHPFTDWAVGQCLTCVEEVRLIKSHNKFEVINKIKPYITNDRIEVHPKGRPVYEAKNTTSYLFFSNFKDALPLDDDGRRYCVLFSQWQSRERLAEFTDENPHYYTDLYRTISTSAGALRKWLINHEQEEDFNPLGNAPQTAARRFMVRMATPEFVNNLHDLISDHVHHLVTEELLSISALTEVLHERALEVPTGKAMTAMLSRAKFDFIGRHRIVDGDRHYLYSKTPERWQPPGEPGRDEEGNVIVDKDLIREYVKKKLREISEDL